MASPDGARPPLQFGPFVFDRAAWRLTREGAPVPLQDKMAVLLDLLLARPGVLWTREELYARLWPGVFVSDDSLFQVVRKTRSALGDDSRNPRWIETVQGRGYRFLGQPVPVAAVPVAAVPVAAVPVAAVPRAGALSPRALTGRDAQVEGLRAELLAGGGLWTLTGPGGVGKTSLALALRDAVAEALPGGVAFCDAAEITEGPALAAAVGRAVGLDRGAADEPEVLAHALDGLGAALLIVDNLEQMVETAAPLLNGWLGQAPALRLVATSRIRLGLRAERLIAVPPLPLPEPECARVEQLRAAPAGALLLDQIARVAPRAVSDADAPALVELLAALGGLPLAIELAAPRLRLLSPDQLVQRMGRPLEVLRGGPSDRPARHSALRSTILASWELLTPAQQQALCRLSAFSGPFPAEAAEAALEEGPDAPLDVLTDLMDHSLIHRRAAGSGRGLADLLELLPSIRAFARERSSAEEVAAATARIDAWYAEPERFGGPADLAAVRAQRERANLSAALDRALARGDATLACGLIYNLGLTLLAHGPLAEAVTRLGAVAALPGLSPRARAGLELRLAEAHLASGALDLVPALLDRAEGALGEDAAARGLLLWLRCDHVYRAGFLAQASARVRSALEEPALPLETRARLLMLGGTVIEAMGQPREGLALLREARALAERLGLAALRTRVLLEIGWACFVLGDLGEATAAWDLASAHALEIGDRLGQARALERQGQALFRQGRLEQAETMLNAAVALFQRGGFPLQEGGCLDQLARIAMHQGRVELAERRFRAAIDLLEGRRLWMAAATSRANFGTLFARLGRMDEAHAELSAAYARQQALGGDPTIVLHNLGKVELFRGDPASARARISAALAAHEAGGRRVAAAHARASLGQVALATGQDAEARALLDQAVAEFRAAGEQGYGLGSALGMLALAVARLGEAEEAARTFDAADSVLERAGLPEPLALARVRRGRAAVVQGALEPARAACSQGEADLAQIGLTAQGELGWELAALVAEIDAAWPGSTR